MSMSDRGVLERCLGVYFKSIDKLKENVKTLLQNYHSLMNEKMDCESGQNISINPQSFNNAVTEALNRCDELETQLQGLESWVDLPIVNTSDHGANFEDASEDAQRLVGMLQQVQSAMLSAVSEKALKEALPERLKAVAAAKTESHEQQQRTAVMAKQQFYQQQHQQQMSEYPAAVSGFMQEEVQRPHQDTLYTQQQSRIYGDVSSPYNHPNQPFLGERTGPDNNMMGP